MLIPHLGDFSEILIKIAKKLPGLLDRALIHITFILITINDDILFNNLSYKLGFGFESCFL